jgi:hydroxyacylglutathione hydrolase
MKFITLLANNPGFYTGRTGNNTFLFPGTEPALIDAGVGEPRHLDAIAEALESFRAGPLARVIVTHEHSDHASGAQAIAARWPRVRFFKFPLPERDARYGVTWEPLADGEDVMAGDERLRVIHTPGHALDHIALWHEPSRTLFGGDLAVPGTTVVIPGGRGGSIRSYLRSLDRVLELDPLLLLPAHGAAIHDVRSVFAHYKFHRQEREDQVVAALTERPHTTDELVARLYAAIHPRLAGSARASIVAHLEKLQEERRASPGPDGTWTLVSSGGSTS